MFSKKGLIAIVMAGTLGFSAQAYAAVEITIEQPVPSGVHPLTPGDQRQPLRVGSGGDAFNTGAQNPTTDKDANEFTFTVTGTPNATVSVRAQSGDGAAIDNGGIIFDTDTDYFNGGEATSFTIGADGTVEIVGRIGNTNLVAVNNTGNIAVAVSEDGVTWVSSPPNHITVDRQSPYIASVQSPDPNTILVTLSEPIVSDDATDYNVDGNQIFNTLHQDTNFTLTGDNAFVKLQGFNSISYDEDVTVRITTNILKPATNNQLKLDYQAHDLAGNAAIATQISFTTTAAVSLPDVIALTLARLEYIFFPYAEMGGAAGATNAFVTKISNRDITLITVEGPSGIGSNLKARFVNLDDNNSAAQLTTNRYRFEEKNPGTYQGFIELDETTLSEGTRIGVEVTMDDYATSIVSTGKEFTVDNTKPTVLSATQQDNQTTIVTFSESMATSTDTNSDGIPDLLETRNYFIDNRIYNPTNVELISNSEVLLTHAAVVEGIEYTITVNPDIVNASEIKDATHNPLDTTANEVTFTGIAGETPVLPIQNQVILEYILFPYVGIGNSLGATDEFVTKISNQDIVNITVLWPTTGSSSDLKARFVNLDDNNSTDQIITSGLSNFFQEINPGKYSGQVELSSTTLSDGTRIGVEVTADDYANSIVSTGKEFTVDNTNPTVLSATPQDNKTTIVTFSEPMATLTDTNTDGIPDLLETRNYVIDNGIGNPTNVELISNTEVSLFHKAVTVGEVYSVTVNPDIVNASKIKDATHNPLDTTANQVSFTGAAGDTPPPPEPFNENLLENLPEFSSGGVDQDGNLIESNARFIAGVVKEGSESYGVSFTEEDLVSVVASITVDSEHVGKDGSILVVVIVNWGNDSQLNFMMVPEVHAWELWDGVIAHLKAAEDPHALKDTEIIKIVENSQLFPASFDVFVGYMLEETGNIYYNAEPLHFTVTSK